MFHQNQEPFELPPVSLADTARDSAEASFFPLLQESLQDGPCVLRQTGLRLDLLEAERLRFPSGDPLPYPGVADPACLGHFGPGTKAFLLLRA
jgi:hypothetical protein